MSELSSKDGSEGYVVRDDAVTRLELAPHPTKASLSRGPDLGIKNAASAAWRWRQRVLLRKQKSPVRNGQEIDWSE